MRQRGLSGWVRTATVVAALVVGAGSAAVPATATNGPTSAASAAIHTFTSCSENWYHGPSQVVVSADGSTAFAVCPNGDVEKATGADGLHDSVWVGTSNVTAAAISADGQWLYAAGSNSDGASLVVVRTSDMQVVRTIPVSDTPRTIALSPDGSHAWLLSNYYGTSAADVDLATGNVAEVPGLTGVSLAFTPDGTQAWVADPSIAGVQVVDTATDTVVTQIKGISMPDSPVFSSDGTTAYVPSSYSDTISVVDTATDSVTSTIQLSGLADGPTRFSDLTLLPGTPDAYVAGNSGEVDELDLATPAVVAQIPVDSPDTVQLSPDGTYLYVAAGADKASQGTVDVIRTADNTVASTMSMTGGATASALSASGSRLWVASKDSYVSYLSDVELQAPTGLTATPDGRTTTLSWNPPLAASGVQSYQLQRSTDGGTTWADAGAALPGSATSTTVPTAPAGTALEYRLRDQLAGGGGGDTGDILTVVTDGTAMQRLTVRTASGAPVVGGKLTWSMPGASSAHAASAADDGTVTFPEVVAGKATVSLGGGKMPDGSLVDGSWPVLLGTGAQHLVVPASPAKLRRIAVTVQLPNGVIVPDATVGATGFYQGTGSWSGYPRREWNWSVPADAIDTVDGNAVGAVEGFADGTPVKVTATYDDGQLRQSQTVTADPGSDHVTIQLKYMPWLTESQSATTTDAGRMTTVRFTTHNTAAAAPATPTRPTSTATTAATSGVEIALRPPSGWQAKRCRSASKLSGRTDNRGLLTLRVCASASGDFTVLSHGAVAARAVHLDVRHAPAEAPAGLSASSPDVGKAKIAWRRPAFTGGARVSAYRVALSLPKRPLRVVEVSASKLRALVSHLASGRQWTVKVQAVTTWGVGQPATTKVWVA